MVKSSSDNITTLPVAISCVQNSVYVPRHVCQALTLSDTLYNMAVLEHVAMSAADKDSLEQSMSIHSMFVATVFSSSFLLTL